MCRRISAFVLLLVLVTNQTSAADKDRTRQKLYVTNSAGNDVTVVDLSTNKVIGSIEVGPQPHGIAVPAAQDVIYITIEGRGKDKPGELVWIDPRSDKVTGRMDIGPEPNELAVTPDGKLAYIPVSDGHYEVVDLAARKIIKRISTGGRPHNTVCSADGKHMYLAPMGSVKKVFVADTSRHEIVGEIPFSDVVRPIVLAKDEKRLYAEVDNLLGFEVADVAAGKMIERVSSELDEKFKNKPSRSHGLAIRPDQKELWECDVEHFQVHVFDITGEKPKQTATIDIGTQVYWLTFSPDGRLCYVAGRGGNEVAVVDVASRKVQTQIAVGKAPKRLLVVNVPAPGADKDWTDLQIGKGFDAWKEKPADWALADSVKMDSDNPKKLLLEAGSGILVNGANGRAKDLVTKESYGDIELHIEFLIPKGSNSGVKFHAHYEIQIYDSFGVKNLTGADCGGVYPRAELKPTYHHLDKGIPPKVNACKEPGEWQTLDVIFVSPRFDKDGKKTANAHIVKAELNGKLIHENQDIETPTGHAWHDTETPTGPILLQGDHGPVAFRNFRVRPYGGK